MLRLFKKHREAVKKYLLVVVLLIMSGSMVFMFTPLGGSDTNRMEASVLAEVNGSSITTQDLDRGVRAQMRSFHSGYDSRFVPVIAPRLLDEMVLRRALAAQAKKLGIDVSDGELTRALQAIPWLYSNGGFLGIEAYEGIIQQQTGLTVAQFEFELRDSVLQDKIRAVITDGVQVTAAEVHAEFVRRNAKVKMEYVVFDPSQFLKAVDTSPQVVEAFFKKDLQRYKLPEQRRVRYILIDTERVRVQAKPSDNEERQYYTQHLTEYRLQNRVKVAHILFKTEGKTPAEITTLEKTAREALAQVKSGGDFGELAKKYSEDSTAAKAGEIGWIVHGQTVQQFEDAAFKMKPGEVSDLIKTTYGFHIIKVLDKQTAHLQTFEEVKDKIQGELEKQKLATTQQKLTDDLERKLKANPQSFDAVARQAGFDPKESPLFRFKQAVPDLGNSEAFQNLAFQLRQGQIGASITVPRGLAIIQVTEIVPEHAPKLDEVRAKVEQDCRAEQSKVLARQKAQEFAAKAKSGDFRKLAQADGLTVKESNDFTKQDYVEGLANGSQLEAAFALAPGQTSDAVRAGDKSVVFRVVSHSPASEADFAAQKDRLTEELVEEKRNLAFEIYRQNLKQQLLRSRALKLNEPALKQFLASYQKS